jgi:hypothetical protein
MTFMLQTGLATDTVERNGTFKVNF